MKDFYIDKELYLGRPSDDGRTSNELRCYDLLDSLSIEYQRAEHSPADTVECCKEVEKVIGVNIYKNLFLCNRQKTAFYLLVMPALKPFRTSVFSKLIGSSRLSFADAENMKRYLGVTPGSVSVLGLMNDSGGAVRLFIDRDVVASDYFRCHPCVNTATLKLKTSDLLEKLLPALGHSPEFVDLPWEYNIEE